jgi:hypothetical protein
LHHDIVVELTRRGIVNSICSKNDFTIVTAGLVRVRDTYGDYGYCGFYCMSPDQISHFCFSCRILGMGVETWLYERLGRPQVEIVGDVLTDLWEGRVIDWINFAEFNQDDAAQHAGAARIGEVRIRGGCELDAVAHYLRLHTDSMVSETNRPRGAFFIRYDSSALLLSSLIAPPASMQRELQDIGYASEDLATGPENGLRIRQNAR